jgi:hypothetical protein
MIITRSYAELSRLSSFEERFEYLKLSGTVGESTFGFDRYLNQQFYLSPEWRAIRDRVIARDLGCDLGVKGFEVHGRILIHHINPITVDDIVNRNPKVFDPENLILTSHNTHNAIHYGDEDLLIRAPIERSKYDTCPWKNI